MEQEKEKKQKVTTFKLTEELTEALDGIAARDHCTKDAAIRRLIDLGLKADEEIQALRKHVIHRVAVRETKRHEAKDSPPKHTLRRPQSA